MFNDQKVIEPDMKSAYTHTVNTKYIQKGTHPY